MPHFGVKPFPVLQQLVMAAVLGDTAVFKHGDRIAETAGGQSVRDIYGGFASHKIVEVFVDLIFRYRVQRRGGFVEDDKRRVFIYRSGNGHSAGLTAGKLYPFFVKYPKKLRFAFFLAFEAMWRFESIQTEIASFLDSPCFRQAE